MNKKEELTFYYSEGGFRCWEKDDFESLKIVLTPNKIKIKFNYVGDDNNKRYWSKTIDESIFKEIVNEVTSLFSTYNHKECICDGGDFVVTYKSNETNYEAYLYNDLISLRKVRLSYLLLSLLKEFNLPSAFGDKVILKNKDILNEF